MTTEQQYATALYKLVSVQPNEATTYLTNLQKLLTAKGHQRLTSRILSEFEKILVKEKRLTQYAVVTPEAEQTRVLLELYRSLVMTS